MRFSTEAISTEKDLIEKIPRICQSSQTSWSCCWLVFRDKVENIGAPTLNRSANRRKATYFFLYLTFTTRSPIHGTVRRFIISRARSSLITFLPFSCQPMAERRKKLLDVAALSPSAFEKQAWRSICYTPWSLRHVRSGAAPKVRLT